ncbi:hypothetical protein [Parvularcula lutaonensis]|uniref:Uncharacterized protein n=1 Tax=Parvularcula lutaonensis TaxID=491923 RepID=A0ABV7MEG1_9PROT|nr:hypothetical protein [Parvularcula lutaonensis]GGY55342.1 hypothetical protein GCM10007148_26530 [Parvularcula lutaonensis]
MREILGVAAFLAIVTLPGAWIGFSPLTKGFSGWVRLGMSVALSPVVVAAIFIAARLAGVAPGDALWVVLLLSLPALAILWRQRSAFVWPRGKALALYALGTGVPLAVLMVGILDENTRALRSHNFLHSDIVNGFLNGALIPEEMALAGIINGYPWAAHAFQAVASLALDLAPASAFVWSNVAFLLALSLLSVSVVKALGGDLLARASAPLFMAFAVNPVGTGLRLLTPETAFSPLTGDPRYSSFLRKFYLFNQMSLSYVLLTAMLLGVLLPDDRIGSRARAGLLATLLLALAVVYPLFLPVGLGVIGARIVAGLLAKPAVPLKEFRTDILWTLLFVGGALGLFVIYYAIVTGDRVSGTGVSLDISYYVLRKVPHTLFSLALPLAALGWLVVNQWPERRRETMLFVLIALGLGALHVVVTIPHWRNEYKFILAASVLLSPLVPVALGSITASLNPRRRGMLFAAVSALCILPALPKAFDFGSRPEGLLSVTADGTDLRLLHPHPLAGVTDSIRTGTDTKAVIVAPVQDVHLPGFTRRAVYAPYKPSGIPQGIGLELRYLLLSVKGHDRAEFRQRVGTLEAFFSTDTAQWSPALQRMERLGRPLAIVIEQSQPYPSRTWLEANGFARLYADQDYALFYRPEVPDDRRRRN